MSSGFLVAAISMTSTANFSENMDKAEELVNQAVKLGARWVQLPENFSFIGPYDQLAINAIDEGDKAFFRLSELAKKLKIWLFSGSVAETADGVKKIGKKVFNTARVFDPFGNLRASYRKVHLFNLKDSMGNAVYCESDGMLQGDKFVSLEVDGLNVGVGICYDLRFPEQFLCLGRKQPLDLIALPSAFTMQTGMDHWELLLRARAVENQCYVYAANQVGTHGPGKTSYGHAMVVDPWGIKVADSGSGEGIALGIVDRELIVASRNKLPALLNKRLDLY